MQWDDRDIASLLDRPVAYHRVFVDVSGSVHGAVLLSQALYWQQRCPPGRDGWWWKTYEEWLAETGLSRRLVDSARRALEKIGVLVVQTRGFPKRTWWRLDTRALQAHLQGVLSAQHEATAGLDLFSDGDAEDASLADCANWEVERPEESMEESLSLCCKKELQRDEPVNQEARPPSLADCANWITPSLADPPSSLADCASQFVRPAQTDLTEITTEITSSPPPTRPRAREAPQPQPWLAEHLRQRSETLAETRAGLEATDGRAAFAMHPGWRPGPMFADRCAMAGVSAEHGDAQLGEFVSYWQAEGAIARQGQWEHRFLKHLRREAAQLQGDPNGARRSGGGPCRADIVHDTSWLDADTIAYVESGLELARRGRSGEPGV